MIDLISSEIYPDLILWVFGARHLFLHDLLEGSTLSDVLAGIGWLCKLLRSTNILTLDCN